MLLLLLDELPGLFVFFFCFLLNSALKTKGDKKNE
jgi:hypothetical protein